MYSLEWGSANIFKGLIYKLYSVRLPKTHIMFSVDVTLAILGLCCRKITWYRQMLPGHISILRNCHMFWVNLCVLEYLRVILSPNYFYTFLPSIIVYYVFITFTWIMFYISVWLYICNSLPVHTQVARLGIAAIRIRQISYESLLNPKLTTSSFNATQSKTFSLFFHRVQSWTIHK